MTTTAEITPVLIPVSNGSSQATGISSSGAVVGFETLANGTYEGFFAYNGTVTLLAPSPSYASAVNGANEVVGWLGSGYSAQQWLNGVTASSILPGGLDGDGNAVNNSGAIGGEGFTNGSFQAFVTINGAVTWLGTLNSATTTGTSSSTVNGLNDSNEAVGASLYSSTSALTHGFSWKNGIMTDLGTLAGGDNSRALAVNDAGQIVGFSNDSTGGLNLHAVLWQNGAITDLGGLPNAEDSTAWALNDEGQIVGDSIDAATGIGHAVLWQNGTVTDLNTLLPSNSGWVLQTAFGINDAGLIVGYGTYKGVITAFELSLNGLTTPLHTAPAVVSLYESGLSIPKQTVVDSAAEVSANLDALQTMAAAGDLSSITLTDSATPTLTLTPQQLTSDAGVLGKIISSYSLQVDINSAYASGVNVTLTAPAGSNTTVLLDEPYSHFTLTAAANETRLTVDDTVSGESTHDVFTNVTSLRFSDGTQVFLNAHGLTAIQAVGATTQTPQAGVSIDAQGNIAGYAGSSQTPTEDTGFLWSGGTLLTLSPLPGAGGSEAYHIGNGEIVGQSYAANSVGGSSTAVVWYTNNLESGSASPTSLGWLAGDFASIAYGSNDHGAVVGTSYTTGTTYHGFLWQNGGMISLGSLGGSQIKPVAINDATQIVGDATTAAGATHAFLWQNGAMTDLGVLAGGTSSLALTIDSSGLAAGYSTDGSGLDQAVDWSGGQIERLPNLLTNTESSVNGINDKGWMVGWSSNGASTNAVLWANGGIYNLNAFLPSSSGWSLGDGYSINDAGQISGWGTYDGNVASFELTLPSVLTFTVSNILSESSNKLLYSAADVGDSAANIAANLNGLESIEAGGLLGRITLTDSGTPTLAIGAAQLTSDTAVLKDISGDYTLTVAVGLTSTDISGPAGHATTVQFSGASSQYTVSAAAFGTITVSGNGVTDQLSNVAALQFADFTEIVATAPGAANAVTTGNITELYSAVLAREPDLGGLTFYQTYLQQNSSTPLLQFAEWFLSSTEYTSAHNYAQTSAGDTQFIQDSYQNLLHRTPSSNEVDFYLTNVMSKAVAGLTPGTQAYASAEFQAHATMLVYFSASSEFLADVRVTAQKPADSQHWLILT